MPSYILAHDLGTSGNKATLYGFDGTLKQSAVESYATYYPCPNCVEQNPEDWWGAVCKSTRELIEQSGIAPKDVAAVSFSGQMMGCLPVGSNGRPLRNSIIWADMRAVEQERFIRQVLGMESVYRITGHRVGASYTSAKLLWLKDNEPELYCKTDKVLQAKDYIVFRLTGQLVTDYSDASGTGLFDIEKKQWSDDIIREVGLAQAKLPQAHPSTDIVGKVTKQAAVETGLLEGTPVVIGGGDGCCATVGAGAVEEGKTYNAIGSSAWIASATKIPIHDSEMRIFNFVHLDPSLYSPCGTMQTAGYSLSWLKNTLCLQEAMEAEQKGISAYRIIDEKVAQSPPGANDLLFLPYLLGERSPRWNPEAQGAFIGLTMTTTKEDMLRSVLEGVGYNLRAILDVFAASATVGDVTVIGGGAQSTVWLQILADIWQKPLLLPRFMEEATSMGAAICAGVGIGAFQDFKVISKFNPIMGEIKPRNSYHEVYDKLYNAFNKAYDALCPVYKILS
jgi:xylulokinase